MRKTITLLTILLFVVFMVGCENAINPTQPQTQNDNEGISLAKKDKGEDCASITAGEVFYGLNSNTGVPHYLFEDAIPTGFDIFGYNYQGTMFKGLYYNSYAGGDGFGPWTGDDETYLAKFPAAANHWAWPYRDVKLAMKWNEAWIAKTDCDGDGDGKLDRHYGFNSYIGSGAWLTNHQSGEDDGCKWNYFVKIVAAPADAYRNWVLSGDFDFEFVYGGIYPHEVHIETFNDDGTFTATGIGLNDSKTWTATGTVLGDVFTMRIEYDINDYFVDVVGTIAENGTIEGTWSNDTQSGTWESTSGNATPGPIWYNADDVEIGEVIWGAFAVIQTVENDKCAGIHGLQYNSPDHSGFGGW